LDLYKITFLKTFQSYVGGDGAAFELAKAVKLVAEGFATFDDPQDLIDNQAAVTAAIPTTLVHTDVYIQLTNDGSDPTVVMRRNA
jgi:hypothetical protein